MTINVKVGKNQVRLIVGIFISIAAFAALLWFVDEGEILSVLKQMNLIWIVPVLGLLLISLITRAAAWRIILQKRISLKQSFLIVNAGYFVNTIFPFRIGEITRAFLLIPSGFTFWEAIPTIILERMFDFGIAAAIFLTSLPFAVNFSQGAGYAYLLASIVPAGLVMMIVIVKYQTRIIAWLEGLSLPWAGVQSWLSQRLRSMISGMTILKDPSQIALVFLFMFFSWAIALFYQFFLLKAFIPDAKLIWAVFALGALALGVSVPSSPGNIGLYEASITLALTAFGVDRSIAFTYALTSHVISLGMTTLFGSFALVREGYALRDIWQFSQQQEKDITDE